MAGRRLSPGARERLDLKNRISDPLRHFEAPKHSVHIYERDEIPPSAHTLTAFLFGIVLGMTVILGILVIGGLLAA